MTFYNGATLYTEMSEFRVTIPANTATSMLLDLRYLFFFRRNIVKVFRDVISGLKLIRSNTCAKFKLNLSISF